MRGQRNVKNRRVVSSGKSSCPCYSVKCQSREAIFGNFDPEGCCCGKRLRSCREHLKQGGLCDGMELDRGQEAPWPGPELGVLDSKTSKVPAFGNEALSIQETARVRKSRKGQRPLHAWALGYHIPLFEQSMEISARVVLKRVCEFVPHSRVPRLPASRKSLLLAALCSLRVLFSHFFLVVLPRSCAYLLLVYPCSVSPCGSLLLSALWPLLFPWPCSSLVSAHRASRIREVAERLVLDRTRSL